MEKSRHTSDRVFKAAKSGELSFFKRNIEEKSFRELILSAYHIKSGETALHYAVENHHLGLVEFLLREGFNIETMDFDGKTALHKGAQHESVDCVRYLLALDPKLNALKKADWTPLMLACTKPNVEMVNLLLEAGADTALNNKDGWNCFHIAVREGHLPVVQTLLTWNRNLSNTTSKNGRTPLHTAALHGHKEIVEYLLNNCCYEPDARDCCGTTPLMDALRDAFWTQNVDTAKLLICCHKADVDTRDNLTRNSLHLAAEHGATESIRYLVNECGVKPDSRCLGNDVTALHIAAKEGRSLAIGLLLSLGADVKKIDNKGRTALHIASGAQQADCVKILLQNSAELTPDFAGTLPQQLAKKSAVVKLFQHMEVT